MARRRKLIEDEATETPGEGRGDVAGAVTDPPGDEPRDGREADEEEEDEVPDDGSNLAEPTEVEGIERLPQERQDEILRGMEQDGKDVSILRARINQARRKQWQHTALLSRLDPVRAPDGTKIRGMIERFEAPFSDVEIKDYARRFCGGGTYEIAYYDANHQVGFRERFDVPGRPKSREEIELAVQNQSQARPTASASGDDKTQEILRSMAAARPSAETESLREQLRMQQIQQLLAEQDRKHAEQMAEMRRMVEASTQAAAKKPSLVETVAALLPALAPFVPVLKAYVDRGGNTELADVMKMVRDGQADTAKQVREALEANKKGGGSGGPLEAATTKLVDLAIARTLGGAGHRDPQDLVFKMLEQMLPNIMERAMDIASMKAPGEQDDDGKISPRWALEQFGQLMKPLLEQAAGRRGGGGMPGGPASAGMPGMPMMPGMMPGMPGMPMIQAPGGIPMVPTMPQPGVPVAQPMPGVYPYTHAQPAPGVAVATATSAAPVQAVQTSPPVGPAAVAAMAQAQAQAAMAAQAAAAQAAATPAPPADIDPRLFQMMHQALMAGKAGDELAKQVDDELEAIEERKTQAPRLLSERAVEILETTDPKFVVAKFFEAAPPELLRLFCDPTGQVAPHAVSFAMEFCEFFYDDDEAEAEKPAATAPVVPVAPVVAG